MLRLHPDNIKGLMQNGYNYGYLRVLRNMLRPHYPGNRIEYAGTCCAILKGTQEHAAPALKQTNKQKFKVSAATHLTLKGRCNDDAPRKMVPELRKHRELCRNRKQGKQALRLFSSHSNHGSSGI